MRSLRPRPTVLRLLAAAALPAVLGACATLPPASAARIGKSVV